MKVQNESSLKDIDDELEEPPFYGIEKIEDMFLEHF